MDNYHSNRQNFIIILLMKVSKLVSVCGVEDCRIAFDLIMTHSKVNKKMDSEISTCIEFMETFFCLPTNYSNLIEKVRELIKMNIYHPFIVLECLFSEVKPCTCSVDRVHTKVACIRKQTRIKQLN